MQQRKRTRWSEEYKYTSQVQHADTGEIKQQLELNIRNEGRPGNRGAVEAFFLVIRYHQSPVLICYELETVSPESGG